MGERLNTPDAPPRLVAEEERLTAQRHVSEQAIHTIGSCFIDPGPPWQNAWIESFSGRFRDEFCDGWQSDSVFEAQVLAEGWRIDHNTRRPRSAHGLLTRASSPSSGPPPTNPNSNCTWTTHGVRSLGVHRSTAWELWKRGEFPIPLLQIGSRLRVSKRHLAASLRGDP